AMRPPIEAVQPELPEDLLPGLSAQIQANMSEPAVDLVQAQRKVREKTRLEAAAKVVKDAEEKQAKTAAKTKGKGRGRGRGRREQQEPSSEQAPKEQEPSSEQAPKEQEPSSKKAPKEQEPSSKKAPKEQESSSKKAPKKQEPSSEQAPEEQEPEPEKEAAKKLGRGKKPPVAKSTPEDSPRAALWQTK
ncbi:KIF21B, partial [Symbiodinium sp. CCMP2456]